MRKDDLYEALEILNKEKMETLLKAEQKAEEHEFSKEFESKMDRLIRKWKRKFVPGTHYRLRRSWLTAATVLFLISFTLGVEASRAAIFEFVTEIYEKYSNIIYEEKDIKNAPDKILELREPEWGDQYVETSNIKTVYVYKTVQENIQCQENVYFRQFVMSYYRQINTEHASFMKDAVIDGIQIYSITYDNHTTLLWNDGEYYYELNSKINKKDLLALIETMYD